MSKTSQRVELKQLRMALSTEQVLIWSQNIYQNILKLQAFHQAQQIGVYSPLPGEVTILGDLVNHAKKDLYLPVIKKNQTLAFYAYTSNTPTITNRFQIIEPDPKQAQPISIDDLDIIFIPMLGFDASGHRLGMGKGYYDRSIKQDSPYLKIGLAFSCQKIKHLPQEKHDVKMDFIITEKQILQLHSKEKS